MLALTTPETTDYVYDLMGNLRQERLPNGVISDYTYDELNHLELLREFVDGENSQYENEYESGVDTLLAEYDYDLAANGRRTGVTEETLVDSVLEETRVDWLYDNLGTGWSARFTTALGPTSTSWLIMCLTWSATGTIDETTDCAYDANDRLTAESPTGMAARATSG